MRVVSYNVNGLRAALKKGFLDWLSADQADVVCLQEIKAMKEDIDVASIEALGYHTHWFSAEKKGYSGVAIFSKKQPEKITKGTNHEQSDREGRVIQADFGELTVINAYFPSGTSGDIRQDYKYIWLDEFMGHIRKLKKKRKNLIICGDYNIAHREIDIHNPVSNKNSSGFLPEERAWFDQFLEEGFIDCFRHINKDPHHYSWWSQRFPSVRAENKGWRIDYISVTQSLAAHIKTAGMLPDARHSDHCPVYTEFKKL
jgi:exodeoxyribonuclease-3